MKSIDLRYFRVLALIEGSSLLILMFIAMPLRWATHDPSIVRTCGMIHGLLFLMFLYTLITVAAEHKWGAKKFFLALILGCLPLGSFWFDRNYLR